MGSKRLPGRWAGGRLEINTDAASVDYREGRGDQL